MNKSSAVRAQVRHCVARNWRCHTGVAGRSLSIGRRLCFKETITKPLNSAGSCTIVNAVMTAYAPDPGPFEKFLLWLSADSDLALKKHREIMRMITRYFVRKGCPEPEELAGRTRD